MEITLFRRTGEKVAPARKLDPKRLKQVMDGRIKVADGSHATDIETDDKGAIIKMPPNLCIMECTSYCLGWDQEPGHEVNDGPPCTSEMITSMLIEINDSGITDRSRAALKKIIPDIINTAPLVWAIDKNHGAVWDPANPKKKLRDAEGKLVYPETLQRNDKDEDYQAAETKRHDMLDEFLASLPKVKDDYGVKGTPDYNAIPVNTKWIPFIRELAAVAKFDVANAETERDMETPAVDLGNTTDPDENPGGIAGGVLDGTYDPGGPPQSQSIVPGGMVPGDYSNAPQDDPEGRMEDVGADHESEDNKED